MKIYSKESFLGWFVLGILFVALFVGRGNFILAFIALAVMCTMMIAACMPKTGQAMAERSKTSPQAVLYRQVFGAYGAYAPFVTVVLFVLSQVVTVYWPKLFVVSAIILVAGVIHFAWFLMMLSMHKRRNG